MSTVDRARDVVQRVGTTAPVQRGLRAVARRASLPPAAWKRLPAADPAPTSFPGIPDFWIRGAEPWRREFQWRGIAAEEPESMRVWAAMVQDARVVLDVGANLGSYALLACAINPACTVTAYEPVPELAAFLQASVADNEWGDRCEVRAVAVGDEVGDVEFHSTGRFGTMSSLDAGGFRGRSGEVIVVPATTIDADAVTMPTVDVVKIDVEGFEHLVLRGMTDTVARARPTIFVECLPDGPYREVDERLTAAGYSLFHLLDDGPRPVERIQPDVSERCRNFLGVGRDDVRRSMEAWVAQR